jgi:hypothetical protein
MRAVLGAAAIAVVGLGSFGAGPASACSVCQAGDSIFSSGAAGPRAGGSVSLYLEYQGYRKASGLAPEEPGEAVEAGNEVNRGRQLGAQLTWGVSDRWSLSAQIPFKSNFIRERPDEGARGNSRLTGLGDLSFTADYVLWRDRDVLPAQWLALRWFGKAPTGDDRERTDLRIDPHLQLGTGSWDLGAGLGWGYRMEWGSLYASALYRMNRAGANRYEYGDVVLANVAIETPIGTLTGLSSAESNTVGVELNYRHARRDDFGSSAYRDSGGSVLYVTPSLRIRVPGFVAERTPSLRFAVQLPLGQGGLRGEQKEGMVWSIGLILPLR